MLQLRRERAERFESGLTALLREEFPERCSSLSIEHLRLSIKRSSARAEDIYGITEEDALTKFVYLTWLLGEDFDLLPLHSWIRDILLHSRSGSERMEIILSGIIHLLNSNEDLIRVIEEPHEFIP